MAKILNLGRHFCDTRKTSMMWLQTQGVGGMLTCHEAAKIQESGALRTEVGMNHFDRMMLLVGLGLVLIGAGAILLKYEADVVAFVTGTPVAEAPKDAAPLAAGQEVAEPLPETPLMDAPAVPEVDPSIDGAVAPEPAEAPAEAVPAPGEIATPEPASAPEAARFPFFSSGGDAGTQTEPATETPAAQPVPEPEPVAEVPAPEPPAAAPEPAPAPASKPDDSWSRTVLEMKPALRQPEPKSEAAAP